MRNFILVALFITAFAGCTTAEHVRDPEGHDFVHITCDESFSSAACQRRANKECPFGYLMQNGEAWGAINGRGMIVECKPPKEGRAASVIAQ